MGAGTVLMKEKSVFQKSYVMVFTALFCNLLWGSAFPCIKIGYRLFAINSEDISSQILFAGIRFTLAGILTILIGSLLAKKVLYPHKRSIGKVLNLALFQTVLQYFFFYIALAHTTGVKASVIEASNVFMAIIFSALFLRNEAHIWHKLLWCIPGFIGVMLVNLNGSSLSFDMKWNGEGFILFSTMAAAASTVLIKKYSSSEDPVMLSGWQFTAGGLIMSIAGCILGGHLHATTISAWFVLLYLAFVSAAAYSLWSLLLKYNPVSKVAVFSFSNPVFGVILSALLLKEDLSSLGWQLPVALLLVCIGIYMVNLSSSD